MQFKHPLRAWQEASEGYFYRLVLVTSLLLLLLMHAGLLAENHKLILQKHDGFKKPKIHPHAAQLAKPSIASEAKRNSNYERLLVILVEFAEEIPDDPLTTGNGLFQNTPDPTYLYSIGSPPHDREYFMANLEAMRHYYQAVSSGYYNLQYDVYPDDGTAIRLPHPMGYYNPPDASSALFVERMEEYFQASFSLADQQYPEIDFASYGHYMIIHAGSDWQHDVFGDTPSDIPSFFIRVSDDKAVSVNGGSHLITHACNVPATISQDFYSEDLGGALLHSGYGALNSVLVHEFGHSLGLVDLYNVYDFQPMVGVFDIMDSGGGGYLLDQLEDGNYVMVEGILPALPGAFSRALLFEDFFRGEGYMKDAGELPLYSQLDLAASSMKQTGTIKPNIIKIPLGDKEYVLLENRSVDPDGDGATAVYSTLDSRVILYPTPIDDPTNQPSYEYDYLLPSFQKANGDAVGGGILAWHINEDIIYHQGVFDADGSWVSNYENNTVNTDYNNRGIRVIEADAMPDIGNIFSWHWTGTPYEYFFKSKPVLNTEGAFANWSLMPWTPKFAATSKPALTDNNGVPSLYWLDGISNPAAVMNFTLKSGFFDEGEALAIPAGAISAPIIDTSFATNLLPLITPEGIYLYSTDPNGWFDMMGLYPLEGGAGRFPIIKSNQSFHPYPELLITLDDRIRIVAFWDDDLDCVDIDLSLPPSIEPLEYQDYVFAATQDAVFRIQDGSITAILDYPNAQKLKMADGRLYIFAGRNVKTVNPVTMEYIDSILLPGDLGDFEPVIFRTPGEEAVVFVPDNSGNIYQLRGSSFTQIFSNNTGYLPTQLGIMANESHSPILFFGLGDRAYAMQMDGTLLDGFPYREGRFSYQTGRQVFALETADGLMMQLPIPGKGYLAISLEPTSNPYYSLSLPTDLGNEQIHYDAAAKLLYWHYTDEDNRLHYQSVTVHEDPLLWRGHLHGEFLGNIQNPPASDKPLTAYVYPNPVQASPLRVKLQNLIKQPITINIYDAGGTLVFKQHYDDNGMAERDIQIAHQFASGVYFLTVQNGSQRSRLKFAVIN